jgi:cellulose synthase/poly-beta-1,6-N-acetylglucosamine synthase-like glycosyltransferase
VLRIDADTIVTRSVLFGLIRHFRDPSVGGASGMPLPRVQSSWICRMRPRGLLPSWLQALRL